MTAQIKSLYHSDPTPYKFNLYQDIISLSQEIKELKKSLSEISVPENKKVIAIPFEGSTHLVHEDDIIYCQAEGNYCRINLDNKSILLSKTLKRIEHLLPDKTFIRCHQSFLVNKKYIRSVSNKNFMKIKCRNNIQKIPISRSKMQFVMNWIQTEFIGSRDLIK